MESVKKRYGFQPFFANLGVLSVLLHYLEDMDSSLLGWQRGYIPADLAFRFFHAKRGSHRRHAEHACREEVDVNLCIICGQRRTTRSSRRGRMTGREATER
jgi:hypothetical protein